MKRNEFVNEKALPENGKRRSFITSGLAGGAFGLVISTVFLLMGIVDMSPIPFVGGITLLTSSISGLSGLCGAVLDDNLQKWGLESPAIRAIVIFLVITFITFGTALIVISNLEWGQVPPTLQQLGYPGMFLGLVFGILVALINHRLWVIQQKVHLLRIENRYLTELAEKDHLLQEAARNMTVAEERNTMARELHDSISQGIHGIVYSLRSLRRQLGDNSHAEEIISHLEQTTHATQQELRRMIMELTPSPLEDNSLVEALKLHCDLFSRRQQISIDLQLKYDGTLTSEQEVAVYRIVQEAMANIQQHANTRHVVISLANDQKLTRLRISDHGVGFDPASVQMGNGLVNMATRARQNNAIYKLESRPGTGTVIEVDFSTDLTHY